MNLDIAISQFLVSPPDKEQRKSYYILGEENCPSLKAICRAFLPNSKVFSDGKVREFNEDIPELHIRIVTTGLAEETSLLGENEEIFC